MGLLVRQYENCQCRMRKECNATHLAPSHHAGAVDDNLPYQSIALP